MRIALLLLAMVFASCSRNASATGSPDASDAANRARIVASVVSVQEGEGLVAIHTSPGGAGAVAVLLDGQRLPSCAGTVSGHDTVFAAVRKGSTVEALASEIRTALASEAAPTGR